jgi:methylmalonyl-CoA mutase
LGNHFDLERKVNKYKNPVYTFKVRDREIKMATHRVFRIPKKLHCQYKAWGDILRWCLQENVPGEFPFTAGLYPFKRGRRSSNVCWKADGNAQLSCHGRSIRLKQTWG